MTILVLNSATTTRGLYFTFAIILSPYNQISALYAPNSGRLLRLQRNRHRHGRIRPVLTAYFPVALAPPLEDSLTGLATL